ncbi:tripartite tricarboxylate transporter substrate binding protein [Cupriavidus necator]|uniref:Bug family tripartite tricarboxylate transporter substrate binding protein n=1 Tax=Cupriavidus necator TaxID=106590 RepID=UPI00149017A4|nr:tripartite tricarboxylate transporter substrate binding protein [Cupriavidus necator]NOV23983.1 tripartite tricarboxylate transporter substrate binding protein [Cupriavidus necator]
MKRRFLCQALACLALVSTSGVAFANSSPEAFQAKRPLRLIAPSSPGGILDLTSRLLGKTLSEQLGQPVVVENLPGAGGVIGMQAMLRAEPDGHTLVMGSLGPNAANYALHDKLPYKLEDFAPVAHVLTMPDVVVINPKLPVKTIAELAAYARTRPNGLSMAVSTSGSSGHLAGDLLKQRAGITAVDVIYRGASPALTDLVAGQVDFMVDNLITALPLVRAGKLRALAVTTRQRAPELPDTPTMAESGYRDFDVSVWLGLFVSSRTPPAVVQALNVAVNKALADPALREKLAQQGGTAAGGSTRQFDSFVRAEKARWEQVIKDGNIKPE